MIPVFAVGAASTALRLLRGKAVLVSYAYIEKGSFVPPETLPKLTGIATESWCDSGAFTIWNRDRKPPSEKKSASTKRIDVELWAQFIQDHAHLFTWFITLDEIGSAAGSVENWRRLLRDVPKALHSKLVPVWHEGDPLEHLDEYEPGKRLVGLGRTKARAAGPAGLRATREFYDEAFNAHPDGIYHFLGNCNPVTIEPYPARSFDATTWERDSAYGNSHGWPWSGCSKETRMKAYIEAISTIEYRPRSTIHVAEQIDLFQEAS